MTDAKSINLELCRALGITDVKGITKVQLTLEPGQAPQLVVHRLLVNDNAAQVADSVQSVIERLQLKPTP